MIEVTSEQVMQRLRGVMDPELHKDIVSLNMVKSVTVNQGKIGIHVELTTPACPLREQIKNDIDRAVKGITGVESVEIEWSAQVRSGRMASPRLETVRNIVAVGAGKGGVGKSTLSVLLAYGLKRYGARVGLMDADVYGPSIPTMVGVEGSKPQVQGEMLMPIDAGGVKIMSIGFMIDRNKPLIWRGPMVHGVVKQFLEQVDWGDLDYLVVDLPPGTGDVPLTLAQSIPMTGAIVVCTPQDVALLDAMRAVKMYEQLNVGCLGIIENMSYYLCPNCGARDELFDHGGARRAAEESGIEFLGEIPLNGDLRRYADGGAPDRVFTHTGDFVVNAINQVVERAAGRISVASEQHAQAPSFAVE